MAYRAVDLAWPDEMTAFLRQSYGDPDSSAADIAAKITASFGRFVSRNAVIGKARRLGIKGRDHRAACIERDTRQRPARTFNPWREGHRARRKKIREAPAVQAPLELQPGQFACLMDLTPNMCRYPIGDPLQRGFCFCAHPAEVRKYCSAHAAICYRTDA